MRILFLTPFIPSSERPDALHHLRLLSIHHQVTLIALYRKDNELKDLENIRKWVVCIHTFKINKRAALHSCALSLISPRPLYLAYYYDSVLALKIKQIALAGRFDLIHAHTLRMGLYATQIASIPRVMNIQDVLSTRYHEFAAQDPLSITRLVDIEESTKLRKYEPWLCAQFAAIGVVSEQEAMLLSKMSPDAKICVIRPGVDAKHYSPYPDLAREQTIAFLGRLSYRPNVQTVKRIVKYIFPSVRQINSDIKLFIIGSDPPQDIRVLGSQPGVIVTGRVDDVRPYLGHASVSLCPMNSGGGVKHKILQSLALATPVVTNMLGEQGIGLTPGVDALICEDDEGLASSCISLLKDPAMRKTIGDAGRLHVIQRHGWPKIAESLGAFHNMALNS